MPNRLRSLWEEGKTAFGAWIMMSGPAGAEMIASMGFDYVCIDCQHGLLEYGQMRDILLTLRGIETTPIVRVPANDPAWVGKALDAGAHGVIVPLVNSRGEAEAAAAACRYPPDGVRSYGPARVHQPFGRDVAEINREVVCLPMIETREALDAADEICTTPGVDGIYVGPSDLGLSIGVGPMSPDAPEHIEAVKRIREACTGAGVIPAIHAHNGADAKKRADEGFRMVTVAADAMLLATGSLTELGTARA